MKRRFALILLLLSPLLASAQTAGPGSADTPAAVRKNLSLNTTGSAVVKGNGSGGTTAASAGTDFEQPGCVLIKHKDGSHTRYPTDGSFPSTDSQRHSAWAAACAAFIDYDEAHVGSGNYANSGDSPTIAANHISVFGSSSGNTIFINTSNPTTIQNPGRATYSAIYISGSYVHLENIQIATNQGSLSGESPGSSGCRAISTSGSVVVDHLELVNVTVLGGVDTLFGGSGVFTNLWAKGCYFGTTYDLSFACLYAARFDNCQLIAGSSSIGINNNVTIFRPKTVTVSSTPYNTSVVLNSCKCVCQTCDTNPNNMYVWQAGTSTSASLTANATTFQVISTNASNAIAGIAACIQTNSTSVIVVNSGSSFSTTSANSSDTATIYDVDQGAGGSVTIENTVRYSGSGSAGALTVNGSVTYKKIGPESLPAFSGDVTTTAGAAATTLATVNSNIGTFGSTTVAPAITVNGKGLITAVTTNTVAPLWSSITSTPTTLSGYGITNGVANTTTVNGHALSSNVTVSQSDLSLVPGTNFNHILTTTGSSTNYTLTGTINTPVAFGSGSPALTLDATGKWLLIGTIRFQGDGSYSASGTDIISTRFRRTNNTAANVGKLMAFAIPDQSGLPTFYQSSDIWGVTWSEIYSGTSGDAISLMAGNAAGSPSGTIIAISSSTTFTAIYLGSF